VAAIIGAAAEGKGPEFNDFQIFDPAYRVLAAGFVAVLYKEVVRRRAVA